ncbi:LacI family transcriptional regulator [Histidinibacterium lentulum]|uniref:LacI family transcriptional regulator n=2 Tax=Histidinibacterium lentulum TaxID=2480588 RepID=A0A3N2R7U4_9RHOB|nr:LacI family transcriptional regulator [Histidinibacterium lentulum]
MDHVGTGSRVGPLLHRPVTDETGVLALREVGLERVVPDHHGDASGARFRVGHVAAALPDGALPCRTQMVGTTWGGERTGTAWRNRAGSSRARRRPLPERHSPDPVHRSAEGPRVDMPGPLAIIGYDNGPAAGYPMICLSSIERHGDQLGRRAAEALLSRIGGGRAADHGMLRPDLVLRAST